MAVQRRAAAVVLPKTMPRWTNEMATPHTDTHAREQTRRDEQVHRNADAARAGVEKLADFRQRATESAEKAVQSSVEAACQRSRMPPISSCARWAPPGRRANGSRGSQ